MSVKLVNPVLTISVLGGLEIEAPSGEAIRLFGKKDRALLGFLAMSPGVIFTRERLASLLWSDSGEQQARDSLKQALLRLRRTLESFVDDLFITDRQSVMLAPDRIDVDAGRFETSLSGPSRSTLQEAVRLYRGDLLDGVIVQAVGFEDWLRIERERLRSLAITTLTDLMSRSSEHGEQAVAIDAARRLLSLEPFDETACRLLMRAHVERGERAQALKLFKALEDGLERELAVTPEPETTALYRSFRSRSLRNEGRGSSLISGTRRTSRQAKDDGPSRPTIAILPFSFVGDDPRQRNFADGLTEDLITDLSQISGLSVVSPRRGVTLECGASSAWPAAGDEPPGASYLLEGRIRTVGDHVRITAKLFHRHTGTPIWAQRYDGTLDDIFALQDEITTRVVEVLKVRLLPDELACFARQDTDKAEAYQYFFEGRSCYLQGMDPNSLGIARRMFLKAIEIDPGYARAYANLAACESYLSMNDRSATDESCVRNSLRALELDPTLAEAHAVRGLVLYASGRYQEATPSFDLALKLGPDHYETSFLFARNCRLQGQRDKAVTLLENAIALRPDDYRALGHLALEYKAFGRDEDFSLAARRCIDRIEEMALVNPGNADALAFGSTLSGHLGERDRTEAWADRAVVIAPNTLIVRYNAAVAQLALGRMDRALDWMEQAFRSTPEWQRRLALWMKHHHEVDPLRSHRRVKALLSHFEVEAA